MGVEAWRSEDHGQAPHRHNRRMLRFNAEQLWWNLIRTGWRRV